MSRVTHDPSLERAAIAPARTLFFGLSIYAVGLLMLLKRLASPALAVLVFLVGSLTLVYGFLGSRTRIGVEGAERSGPTGTSFVGWSDVEQVEAHYSTLILRGRGGTRVYIPMHAFADPQRVLEYVRARIPVTARWDSG
jgi:hypothetical protein